MKTLLYYFATFLMGLTVLGCSKKEEKPTPSKTELLTNKNWIELSNSVSPGLPNASGVLITDLYGQYQPCDKDDFLRFETPNVFKSDEGATKCNQSAAQTTTGTWVFNADQTIITITPQNGSPVSFNITELTDSSLKVNYVLTAQGGTNYTFTVAYRKG